MNKEKIGLGIVTYNSEDYFRTLYDSIPKNVLDELVVVNGGESYSKQYECNWIQHTQNKYPAASRNDCIDFLLEKGCEHIFICEDDMIITHEGIFERYIDTSKISGLKYFSHVSMSAGAGERGDRTPRMIVEYSKNISVSFFQNMCNEFTYHHKSCFEKCGKYDTSFRDPFDIDMAFRESQQDYCSPFWWFADVTDSDSYITNNPVATSRLQSNNRTDGSREQRISEQWDIFYKKHGLYVTQIPNYGKQYVLEKLKNIKNNKL